MTAENEVKAAIEQFFQAMDTQDMEMMQRLVAHDVNMVHVGTDMGEIWRGWDELRQATVEQFEGLEYYKANIRDLSINFSTAGDVAYYFHLLDARIKSGGREEVWQGARFTGVFERRDGQ